MRITLGSNIAALVASRRMSEATAEVRQASERLSSGLRINRASDDAAGLAISSRLDTSRRVYSQAIRNANDGISALSIADGALTQLSSVTTRLKELATQSASGSLARTQRLSLQDEADELISEFNRITGTATFNGISLMDGSLARLAVQLGFGTNEQLLFGLGQELSRRKFTNFNSAQAVAFSGNTAEIRTGDLNGDGIPDMAVASGSSVKVALGNGDGSFQAETTYAQGAVVTDVQIADINGDGINDVIAATASSVRVHLNTGAGSLGTATAYATSAGTRSLKIGDVNGDGLADVVVGRSASNVGVLYGQGGGALASESLISLSHNSTSIALGDMNGDGILDIVAGSNTSSFSVLHGATSGPTIASTVTSTFSATGNNAYALGDFNRDGQLDILIAADGEAVIAQQSSPGNYSLSRLSTGFSTSAGTDAAVGDINGDGYLDILVSAELNGQPLYALGNGDGTFGTGTSTAADGASFNSLELVDLNGDGVLEIIGGSMTIGTYAIQSATTTNTTTIGYLDLASRDGALNALGTLEQIMNRILEERGALGSVQSRLQTALATLGATVENYAAAGSRITDADIADEAAKLTRTTILQQAAAAVLGQANQAPALALQLLRI